MKECLEVVKILAISLRVNSAGRVQIVNNARFKSVVNRKLIVQRFQLNVLINVLKMEPKRIRKLYLMSFIELSGLFSMLPNMNEKMV